MLAAGKVDTVSRSAVTGPGVPGSPADLRPRCALSRRSVAYMRRGATLSTETRLHIGFRGRWEQWCRAAPMAVAARGVCTRDGWDQTIAFLEGRGVGRARWALRRPATGGRRAMVRSTMDDAAADRLRGRR